LRRIPAWVRTTRSPPWIHGRVPPRGRSTDVVDATELIALTLEQYAWQRFASRITTATIEEQLSWLRGALPWLADAVDREVPTLVLTRLCRHLVSERINVRDLAGLSQIVLDEKVRTGTLPGEAELLRRVRLAWKSQINAAASSDGRLPLSVNRLPAELESEISSTPDGAELEQARVALSEIAVRATQSGEGAPVLVTSAGVRARVRDLVAAEFPALPVFADDEILQPADDDENGGAPARSPAAAIAHH
jgi:flagellar biosynthesis component FlhA